MKSALIIAICMVVVGLQYVRADACTGNNCQNGSTCQPIAGTYRCICDDQHAGRFCQFGNPCYGSSFCQNGGTCIPACDPVACSPSCQCLPQFTSIDCTACSNNNCTPPNCGSGSGGSGSGSGGGSGGSGGSGGGCS